MTCVAGLETVARGRDFSSGVETICSVMVVNRGACMLRSNSGFKVSLCIASLEVGTTSLSTGAVHIVLLSKINVFGFGFDTGSDGTKSLL